MPDVMGELAAQDLYPNEEGFQPPPPGVLDYLRSGARSIVGGINAATDYLGVPKGEIRNAAGEVVFPTNALERGLQGSSEAANAVAAQVMAPGRLQIGRAAAAARSPVTAGFKLGALAEPAPEYETFIPKAPTILKVAEMPTKEEIGAIKAAAKAKGLKPWDTAEQPLFETTPEAYAETTQLVPQRSVKAFLPGAESPKDLPAGGRAAPIMENADAIAARIAKRLEPMVESDSPLLKFYHTGPVIRGLERITGMTVPEANQFLREWAGQGAGTSLRTTTPPNLRNASFLQYERAQGDPLTLERFRLPKSQGGGNEKGYGMMGIHARLADEFATSGEMPWKNPKPFTFRENWSGNLQDVTTDTHNIRSTLYEMDRLEPGSLPRGWFTSADAYRQYRKEGFMSLGPGDIKDTLEGKSTRKIPRQTEYLPMTEPWYRAAEKVGIAPAEGQSGGWFSYGPITGLRSPPKTIVNLLNDQIEATAKAAKRAPETILRWWTQGKIPLASLNPDAMGELASQGNYA